jgi:pectinesterase
MAAQTVNNQMKWMITISLIISSTHLFAQKRIVVDADGKGDFISIQAAVNSLPDDAPTARIIIIKNGIYREKIFIEKNNIVFEGENREKTIITQDIARDEWRCSHPDDWGVATVNVNGNDITFKNLTIANDYGFNVKEDKVVDCSLDSLNPKKIISNKGHQMALRTMKATRFKAINCYFRAYAGDTVSPWNVEEGMFYFKDCIMEGGVDFYCPRGWAWAENCKFYANTGSAAIWHDGSFDSDSKTILKNCSFDGYEGFNLGRYHRDAQFYLIDCNFSEKMADKDIFLVSTSNIIQWGRRVYYYNCHRKGGDYDWFKNNFSAAAGAPEMKDVTVAWLFKNKWNPEEK